MKINAKSSITKNDNGSLGISFKTKNTTSNNYENPLLILLLLIYLSI